MTKRECDRQRSVLKTAMRSLGWEATDLAKATGIHVSTCRRYLGEYGHEDAIRVGGRNALAVAQSLGLSVECVLGAGKPVAGAQ